LRAVGPFCRPAHGSRARRGEGWGSEWERIAGAIRAAPRRTCPEPVLKPPSGARPERRVASAAEWQFCVLGGRGIERVRAVLAVKSRKNGAKLRCLLRGV